MDDRSPDLAEIEGHIRDGRIEAAILNLRAVASRSHDDAQLLQQIGQIFTHFTLHVEAERCYRQAAQLSPSDPRVLYNLATAAIAMGELSEAERLLNEVIARAPDDFDAYYNRATLRRQAPQSNHVAQIEELLARIAPTHAGAVPLGYAIAKELEDLGEHKRSFLALKRAADLRRRMLSYRVEDDVRALGDIAAVFGADFFTSQSSGYRNTSPIFIVGLPRSGTTLVDRILSAHPQVRSIGESAEFAGSVIRSVKGARNKFDLIRMSASVDVRALGESYSLRTRALSFGSERLIDKTPLNFLYLGLIAKALPNSKIVHVRRGAMDVCYAMYKTLFRMAYPFSYDLSDLAGYYLAYRQLMSHWRGLSPGRFLDLDYEDLVADQETVTRRLLDHCNLGWDDACLSFERNMHPSLTASAAQVRQKIYRSSVGLWHSYETELSPLAQTLRKGGVDIEVE